MRAEELEPPVAGAQRLWDGNTDVDPYEDVPQPGAQPQQMLTTVKVLSLPDPTMIRGRSLALIQSFEAARYMTAIY